MLHLFRIVLATRRRRRPQRARGGSSKSTSCRPDYQVARSNNPNLDQKDMLQIVNYSTERMDRNCRFAFWTRRWDAAVWGCQCLALVGSKCPTTAPLPLAAFDIRGNLGEGALQVNLYCLGKQIQSSALCNLPHHGPYARWQRLLLLTETQLVPYVIDS